ncbi:MAG: 5-deoxy-glucuronate isomerase [Actinomycetota bacterium]|nr:5-deoxy-glucuronate isomerase [Actinomycetota bacterium]
MTTISPTGAAYRGEHVQLDLPVLAAGTTAIVAVPGGIEAALVLLTGDVTLSGGTEPRRARRRDVFDAPATAVYVPPGTTIEITAHERTELALAATVGGALHAPEGATPQVVDATDVVVHDRGQPGWQRAVHDVVAESVRAQRLLVGETFNAAGQWSSFPPHKHDGGDGEPALEEVYYYRFDRPDGFGFQGLYEHADRERGGSERAVFLRHGSVVGIPRGYHPVCAAPGYRLYYLWALSTAPGTPRGLALYEDPAHRWLHDAG